MPLAFTQEDFLVLHLAEVTVRAVTQETILNLNRTWNKKMNVGN